MKMMKKLSKRAIALFCMFAMIAGCVLTYTGPLGEANSASAINDEWNMFSSEEGENIVNSSGAPYMAYGDATVNLPTSAQNEAYLELYVKIWLKDEDAVNILNTAVLELANVTCDLRELSWRFSSQTLAPGMNELSFKLSKGTDYYGTDSSNEGYGPFDLAQEIKYFRVYTTSTAYTADANGILLYDVTIKNTNAAGLNFGLNDSHLQLSNTLTAAPEAIETSVKVDEAQNEWIIRSAQDTSWRSTALANMASYHTIEEENVGPEVGASYASTAMTSGTAFGFTKSFNITIPEYYTKNDIALDFWFKTDVIESKMGYIDLTSAGTYSDERLYFNMNTYLKDVVAGEWYHVVIPVSKGVQDTANPNNFDLQGVDYLRWHSQTVQSETATFYITDVKLVVLATETTEEINTATEWSLFDAGTELAGAVEYYYTNGEMAVPTITESGTVVAGENGPKVGTTYTQVDLTAGEKFGFISSYKGLQSKNKVPNPSKYNEEDLSVTFWLYCSDAEALPDTLFSLSTNGWNTADAVDWTINNFVTLKDGWNYVELRLDTYTTKDSTFDYTNILYAGCRPRDYYDSTTGTHPEYTVTADCTFKMTSIELVVRPDYDQEYNTLLKAGSTLDAAGQAAADSSYPGQTISNGYVTGEEANEFTPPEGTAYTQFDVAEGGYFCIRPTYGGIKESFPITSKYDDSELAIGFWLYNESGVQLPSWSTMHLSSAGWTGTSERWLYTHYTTKLQQGWNYIEIPLTDERMTERPGSGDAFDYQKINFFQFYWKSTLTAANTFKVTDIKLVVREEAKETKTLANIRPAREVVNGRQAGWWYPSTTGNKTLLQTTTLSENGPKVGTTFMKLDVTADAPRYSFNNEFDYRVPTNYEMEDIALSFWMYCSEDTTLSGNKQLMLHSVTDDTDSNVIYWPEMIGKTYKKGWNYVELNLADATQIGTFDLYNMCYMRWNGDAISDTPVTLGISDMKLITLKEPYAVTTTEVADTTTLQYNKMIFSNINAEGETSPYALYIDNDGQPTLLWGTTAFTLNYDVRTGGWTDIKAVRNADQTVSFYINGELLATSAADDLLADDELTFATAHRIGADSVGSQMFVGRIANLKIYSDAECTTCTGNWALNGDIQYVLDPMEDTSGNNNTAVYRGTRAEDWIDYDISDYDFLWKDANGNNTYDEGEEDYWSMLFIPDIQNLTQTYYGYDQIWYQTAQWIADNVEKENIKHVIGAGDNSWSNWDSEYAIAKAGFDKFTNLVSWSNMSGNHEFDWGDDDDRTSTKFHNYFGLDYIESTKAAETYMGSFDDPQEMSTIENSYYRFQVNDVNWMILQLEYHPRLSVLEWAKEVAAKYPADNIIMTTHSYISGYGDYCGHSKAYLSVGDGDQYLGNSTSKVWEELQATTNIKMILCGHSGNGKGSIARKTEVNTLGQNVPALMINAQDKDLSETGNNTAYYTDKCLGMVSILRFSADGSQAALQWYSPQWGKSYNPIGTDGERNSCNIQLSVNKEAYVEKFTNVTAGVAPATEDIPDGYVFAGWYTDNTCTKAIASGSTVATAYAKFVDADILSVKVQVRLDENNALPEESNGTDMRFATTVDTADYQKVGFHVVCEKYGIDKFVETTKVYKKLYKVGQTSGEPDTLLPTEFSPVSEYFLTYTLLGVNEYDVVIEMTPYWITADGTTVYGETAEKYVNQLNEQ